MHLRCSCWKETQPLQAPLLDIFSVKTVGGGLLVHEGGFCNDIMFTLRCHDEEHMTNMDHAHPDNSFLLEKETGPCKRNVGFRAIRFSAGCVPAENPTKSDAYLISSMLEPLGGPSWVQCAVFRITETPNFVEENWNIRK